MDPAEWEELQTENIRLRRVLNLTKAVAGAGDEESLLRAAAKYGDVLAAAKHLFNGSPRWLI